MSSIRFLPYIPGPGTYGGGNQTISAAVLFFAACRLIIIYRVARGGCGPRVSLLPAKGAASRRDR